MKRMTAILLAMVMLISSAQFALASMTTEEKSELYKKAIRELEAYLETPNSSGESLYGILATFQSLGRYEQSRSLNYYTMILIKLYEETYDFEMMTDLELLDMDQRFQEYLNMQKGSPLCSVEELKNYAAARQKQHDGDLDGAMECYKTCMSYYDASDRYVALRENKYSQMYDRAMALQNAGDLAGAYFLFAEMELYEDSENRKRAIENVLGYTPASPSDNLQPVTGLTVKTAKETEITLSWKASDHAKTYEVQYRENNSGSWINAGETNSTGLTVNGLKANTTYTFRVTAAIGKIKAEAAEITAKTSAKPTPTPKPTPTQKPTPTPTPKAELPDGISTVGDFKVEKIADGKVKILKYLGNASNPVIPERIGDCIVISFGDRCFSDCGSLTNVTIPNSVTSLGDYCFYLCTSLTSITIPNSVTSLGAGCFAGCSRLTSITIPNSVTSLRYRCFSSCTSLTSITIPNSVTSLGDSCFFGCSRLTSITIPNSVTRLWSYCFYYCTSLTSITIPNSVTGLGDYCFSGCASLTSITIPKSVKEMGDNVFDRYNNKLIIKVTIGSYAEKYCKANMLQYRAN